MSEVPGSDADVAWIEIGRGGAASGAPAVRAAVARLHAAAAPPGRPRFAIILDGPATVPGDVAGRAEACAEAVHAVATAAARGTVTFAVLGECLGPDNGLALSADVVSLRSGAPFDLSAASLTPGAYAALARKVGTARLNRILLRDGPVTAEELVEVGLADAVHSDRDSRSEAARVVERMRRRSNGEHATYLARERVQPLDIGKVMACAGVDSEGSEAA